MRISDWSSDVCSSDLGVILLTDMFGGTPSNLAISVMEQTKAEVIAGLNLPMLIKLASVRSRQSLEDAVACAQEAGRKRSEERRVGKEFVSTCQYRWA